MAARRHLPVLTRTVGQEAPAQKHKVLLIHESLTARDELEKSLRVEFEVRAVINAEEGWHAVLTDQSIRAVVASLPVLEIDGYGLLQRIRRSKVSRIYGVPVVVIADGDNQTLGGLATTIGASDVISLDDPNGLRDRLLSLIEPGTAVDIPKSKVIPTTAKSANLFVTAEVPDTLSTPIALNSKTENSMSRLDSLNKVLKTLQSSSPGVEASALISTDGLMISSALSKDMDETRVAAMTATLLSLGTRAATELRRGEVSEVIVRGDQGYAVMLSAARGALLLVLATEATPLGLIFFDMREAVKSIKTVL